VGSSSTSPNTGSASNEGLRRLASKVRVPALRALGLLTKRGLDLRVARVAHRERGAVRMTKRVVRIGERPHLSSLPRASHHFDQR